MFELSIMSGIGVFLLSLPGFVVLWRREWASAGGGLFLLSPPCVFYFAYIASFAVRPPFQVLGTLQYDFSGGANDTLFVAQATSLLVWYGFVAGYRLVHSRPLVQRVDRSWPGPDIRLRASIAYLASISASAGFIATLAPLGVFTFDLGYNRVAYLNAMFGAGHMYLLNLIAGTSLLMGLILARYGRRPPRLLEWAAWIAYLVPNALVTNRFLLSSALFALLLVHVLGRIRSGRRVGISHVLLPVGGLVAVGALLGLLRGLSEGLEYAEDRRNPFVFFLWSFDMSEFYQITLANLREFDFGLSWVEDMLFTFLPRAFFPWKPSVYGAVRIQAEVMPGSVPPDGVLAATYPVSIFGEGYANFGWAGLPLAGLLVGIVLKGIFVQALGAGVNPRRAFTRQLSFCLYVLVCANALGYLRSLGWFLAMLVFHGLIFVLCHLIVWIFNSMFRGALAEKSAPRQIVRIQSADG